MRGTVTGPLAVRERAIAQLDERLSSKHELADFETAAFPDSFRIDLHTASRHLRWRSQRN
jgi:hypothetical protein